MSSLCRPRFAAFLLTASLACASTPPPEPEAPPAAVASATPKNEEATQAAVKKMIENFSRVQFGFDSAQLEAETRAALAANAEIMRSYPGLELEIQGHADERGTTDYNLALGDKRAQAVMEYMKRAGIEDARLRSVSYGEERPVENGSSETAWAANRRAEFKIKWKGESTAEVHGTTD